MRFKQWINPHRACEILSRTFAGRLRTNSLDFHCSDLLRILPGAPSSSFRIKQRLDCAALVHCAVSLCHLVEGQSQVEDLAGVDLLAPYKIDQLGQVPANRSRTTM